MSQTSFSAPYAKEPPAEPVEVGLFITRWQNTAIVIRRTIEGGEPRSYLVRIATTEDELSLPTL